MRRFLQNFGHFVLFIAALFLTSSTSAQAVPTFYVDAAANFSGDCSQAAPCRSIGEALNKQRSNVTIRIASGIYRESLNLDKVSTLTLDAEPGAVVSGFDLLTDWQRESDGVYSTAWPYSVGSAVNIWAGNNVVIAPAGLLRTSVWVDGIRFDPVFVRPTAAGTFWADESSDRIYLRTDGAAPGRVEAAVRIVGLTISNSSTVTVRGLTVEGCASSIAAGCLWVIQSQHVTLENVQVHRGSYSGLQVTRSSDVTVRSLIANDNGVRGFGADGTQTSSSTVFVQHLLIEDAQASGNGWRIRLAGTAPSGKFDLLGWDSGQKFFMVLDSILRRIRMTDTYGIGLWLDWRNRNVLVEDFDLDGYRRAGFFGEAHCDTPSYTLRRGTLQNIVRETGSSDYFHADIFITGTNSAVHEDITILSRAANAVLINNYARTVAGCNPVRGVNNVFRNIAVQRSDSGTVINFASDSTSYAGTTLVEASYNTGSFKHNGATLTAEQFSARLASGSRLVHTGSGGAGGQPTVTPSPTVIIPTHTPQPPTSEPTRAPDMVLRIKIDLLVEVYIEEQP